MAKSKVEGIPFPEFEASAKKGIFSPVYLFFGEEDFLMSEGAKLMVEYGVDEATSSFNLDILYGNEIDARQVINIASSYPMMADRRVVIVKEFDKLTSKDALIPFIEKPLKSTCLAFFTSKTDFRQKAFESLKKNATLVSCISPYESEIPRWIKGRVEKMGKNISIEACQLLQSRAGNNLRVLQSEIDKLFIYIGEKRSIDIDEVNNVVGLSKQFNIFELQKAIGKKDLTVSLAVMEQMIGAGDSAIGMVVMLTKYVQKLWLYHEISGKSLNEFETANKLGVSPMFVKEYIEAAKRFPPQEIERCFHALLEADEALKFSADEGLTMTLLFHTMLKPLQVQYD